MEEAIKGSFTRLMVVIILMTVLVCIYLGGITYKLEAVQKTIEKGCNQ